MKLRGQWSPEEWDKVNEYQATTLDYRREWGSWYRVTHDTAKGLIVSYETVPLEVKPLEVRLW